MLAGLVDVRARVPEPEIADVTILAAVWGYEENVVQKELAQTSSSGPVNLRASTGGTIVRLPEGKHRTVLFLAWSRRLYTMGDKKRLLLRASGGETYRGTLPALSKLRMECRPG